MFQPRNLNEDRKPCRLCGTWRAVAAALVLLLGVMPCAAPAQGTGLVGDELFFQTAAFRIPFSVPTGAQVYKAKLWVSRDQGNSWKLGPEAAPEAREFTYTSTDGDGSYWFAVQTITTDSKAIPPVIQGNNNGQVLRVVVDSRPPTVNVKLMQGQEGSAKVEWTVYDEHLRIETLALQYRVPPGNQWYLVPIDKKETLGFQTWNAGMQPIEVQVTVQDRAGNIGKGTAVSSPPPIGGTPGGSGSPPKYTQPDTDIKYVNSTKLRLRYNLSDVGKSGVAHVEVWKKNMPGSWDATPFVDKLFTGDHHAPEPIEVDLPNEEGLYGLTLVARSGVNVSLPAPTGSEPPQMVVRLLRTPPTVTITNVVVGSGVSTGRVTINWQASQKDNLMSRQCITIYYAGHDGTWQAINTNTKLDNIGQYVWSIPQNYADSKISFKVEAVDWAQNVGLATKDNVILDLNPPSAKIQGVDVSPQAP